MLGCHCIPHKIGTFWILSEKLLTTKERDNQFYEGWDSLGSSCVYLLIRSLIIINTRYLLSATTAYLNVLISVQSRTVKVIQKIIAFNLLGSIQSSSNREEVRKNTIEELEERIKKVSPLQLPYTNTFQLTTTIPQFLEKYKDIPAATQSPEMECKIAGTI